jgi:hypothetical protein
MDPKPLLKEALEMETQISRLKESARGQLHEPPPADQFV